MFHFAEKSKEETKKVNEKLYNESIEKSKTLFNFEGSEPVPFPKDSKFKLDGVDAKYAELAKESNTLL